MKKLFLIVVILTSLVVTSIPSYAAGYIVTLEGNKNPCPNDEEYYSIHVSYIYDNGQQVTQTIESVTNWSVEGADIIYSTQTGLIYLKIHDTVKVSISCYVKCDASGSGADRTPGYSETNNFELKPYSLKGVEPNQIGGSTSIPKFDIVQKTYYTDALEYPNGDEITQYAWIIPSGWKYSGSPSDGSTPFITNSPSITVTTDECSGGTITVYGKNSECSGNSNSNSSPALVISRPVPSYSISGPLIVCSSAASFSVNNPPPLTGNISWECGPYVTISSTQSTSCTISATGSGTSWIRATMPTICGNITLPLRTFWAGVPSSNEMNITNSNYGQDIFVSGESNVLWVDYWSSGVDPEIIDYDWDYSSGWEHWETEEKEMVSIVYVPYFSSGYVTVYVRAENACGESGWHQESFEVFQNYYYSISPNPANDYISLSIEQGETTTDKASKTKIEKVKGANGIGEYTVEIWNEKGGLLKKVKSKEMHKQISTRDLLPGKYFVHLIVGGKTYKQQLIIKK